MIVSTEQTDKKINICIIAHNAYGALKGGKSGHAGGVEFQTSLLAKWLAKRGHEVSFITWDEGGPKEEYVEGVRVIKVCKPNQGIPGIRFFYPRWTSLIVALERAASEVYYHNVGEYFTGQIALWCKRNRKKFVFSLASDKECFKPPIPNEKFYARWLFTYGLKNSSKVIAQTRYQRDLLLINFGLESMVIPMPCTFENIELGKWDLEYEKRQKRILWIGRISPEKRPEVLIDLARQFTNIRFEVIGKPADPSEPRIKKILLQLNTMDNIRYHGMVSHDNLPYYYKTSLLLLNTSAIEGFPNTFVEAAGYGLPIVSTVDPDAIITKEGLGYFSSSAADLPDFIQRLLSDKTGWEKCSFNAREYFNKNHLQSKSLARYEKLFLSL